MYGTESLRCPILPWFKTAEIKPQRRLGQFCTSDLERMATFTASLNMELRFVRPHKAEGSLQYLFDMNYAAIINSLSTSPLSIFAIAVKNCYVQYKLDNYDTHTPF